VKKVSPDEPLVAAALVVPGSADCLNDFRSHAAGAGDGSESGSGSRSGSGLYQDARPAAFAAVSSHGRLLIWALPGLVPLASVGPLPPLSAADGSGFFVDGTLIALAGCGASVAKLSIAPPPTGTRAREPETGVVLYDDELAAAADAADEAVEAMAETAAAATATTAAAAAAAAAAASSSAPPAAASTISKDLGRSAGNIFKADMRSSLASLGSVMRATKTKAAVAMEKAKEKIKGSGGSGGSEGSGRSGAGGGLDDPDDMMDPNRRYTPADLAMLFAEAEIAAPIRRVAVAPPPLHPAPSSTASAASATAAAVAQSRTPPSRSGEGDADRSELFRASGRAGPSRSGEGDADRSELFRTSGRAGSGSSFASGSPSSANAAGAAGAGSSSSLNSGSLGTHVSSAAEIRAKYGREKAGEASGGVTEVAGTMEQTRNKLLERGEKLSGLQDKTAQMQSDAEDFHSMAKKLAKQNKSWW